ncbi:DUF2200 family protein [Gemmatimonas sp.]|uniref:DUF2200 family protein n=1 Tax=Gemmatimonas sp. TaxID=1962908 RepID=UPI003DA578EA
MKDDELFREWDRILLQVQGSHQRSADASALSPSAVVATHRIFTTALETFFANAPALYRHVGKITGVICGVGIEEIEDPLMRRIRYMDKLVDELAKGRPMAKDFARVSMRPARDLAASRARLLADDAKYQLNT